MGPGSAALLAALHGRCFDAGWDQATMASLLAIAGTAALVAEWAPEIMTEAAGAFVPAGLALFRVMGREAEILTLGVVAEERRQGIGRALLAAVVNAARECSVAEVFLEVAENNFAAIALYSRGGFDAVGRRKDYYATPEGAADALVLACKI
jgi:ribosomal-protein-alanine N-acetyltransferase